MDIAVITVTPELARKWLKMNEKNRRISKRRVSVYSRDILNGTWSLNGESIKFDTEGKLLDGQHRLEAVIEANTAAEFLVVKGLRPETQTTMDTGRKRSLKDVLSMEGVVNPAVVSAVAKKAILWDAGDRRFSGNTQPTHSELLDFISKTPSIHRSAEIGVRVRNGFKPLVPSVIGLTHHLFHKLDPSDTAKFFARLQVGANLDEGDPILILRNRSMLDLAEGKRPSDKVRVGLVIKAWNAVRNGETMSKIVMTDDGIMPEPI